MPMPVVCAGPETTASADVRRSRPPERSAMAPVAGSASYPPAAPRREVRRHPAPGAQRRGTAEHRGVHRAGETDRRGVLGEVEHGLERGLPAQEHRQLADEARDRELEGGREEQPEHQRDLAERDPLRLPAQVQVDDERLAQHEEHREHRPRERPGDRHPLRQGAPEQGRDGEMDDDEPEHPDHPGVRFSPACRHPRHESPRVSARPLPSAGEAGA
ncbi:MAG: hypothetical protein ACM3ZF_10555 [Mycobacterium leprae]